MGLARYDFVVTPRSVFEGGWVNATEAEAEINRLKDELNEEIKFKEINESARVFLQNDNNRLKDQIDGQVKMREENNRQWGERIRDADESHKKTVLSMQGDKDILMARVGELRQSIQLNHDQRSIKDKITAELVDERDRLQRVLDDTTNNFQELRVADHKRVAELQQLISDTDQNVVNLQSQLSKQTERSTLVQTGLQDRIKELEQRLMAMDDQYNASRQLLDGAVDKLEDERRNARCLRFVLTCLAVPVVILETVMWII